MESAILGIILDSSVVIEAARDRLDVGGLLKRLAGMLGGTESGVECGQHCGAGVWNIPRGHAGTQSAQARLPRRSSASDAAIVRLLKIPHPNKRPKPRGIAARHFPHSAFFQEIASTKSITYSQPPQNPHSPNATIQPNDTVSHLRHPIGRTNTVPNPRKI
jgi:hypothetical protein